MARAYEPLTNLPSTSHLGPATSFRCTVARVEGVMKGYGRKTRIGGWAGLTIAGLYLAGGTAQAQPPVAVPKVTIPDRPDNTNVPRDPLRLIGNIHWVGHSQVGAFLLKTSQGYILIDSTSSGHLPWLRANLEKLGVNLRDIKIMLNLHAHAEHIGGFAMMKELTGATIVLSRATADEVATGGRTDFRENGSEQYKPFKSDRIVEDGGTVTLGEVTLTAHLTPGHTKGATTWTTTVQEDGKTYNVVFMGGMAVPGIDRSPLLDNLRYPNVVTDYQQAFAKLRTLACDVWFYPRATTIRLDEKLQRVAAGAKPNPFVDPVGCQWYIDFYEYEFADQLAQQLRARAARREQELKGK
jgi:metallo-beta-lactamase class B